MSERPVVNEALVRVHELRKVYRSGDQDLVLFDALSFEVGRGEMLAITGESGSGKSTLLHLLGALDTASGGEVWFRSNGSDTPVHQIARQDAAASAFRSIDVGYVW